MLACLGCFTRVFRRLVSISFLFTCVALRGDVIAEMRLCEMGWGEVRREWLLVLRKKGLVSRFVCWAIWLNSRLLPRAITTPGEIEGAGALIVFDERSLTPHSSEQRPTQLPVPSRCDETQ
jgi:hypothetical protein